MHYGLDVSSNNAHPINWGAAFAHLSSLGAGAVPFVIVKINQGTGYINPLSMADLAAAKAAGFVTGGYLMDEGNQDPGAQEATYRRIAGNLPQFDDDELPDGLSTAQYAAHLNGLIAQQPAVQYLNQSEVRSGFNQSIGLWLAEYNGQPGNTIVAALIHQYNDVGTIPGCQGQFDMNAWTGSEDQFNATFGLAPAPTPAPPTEEEMSGVTDSVTDSNGVRHRACILYPGTLQHLWNPLGSGRWYMENVAAVAGNGATPPSPPVAALTFDANQVPSIAILVSGPVTYLVIAGQQSPAGEAFEFFQTVGTATWGAAQLTPAS